MKHISSQSTRGLVGKCVPLAVVALWVSAAMLPARAATKTWDGSSDGAWGNGANWSGGTAPVTGDDLVFPAGISRTAVSNTLPAGTVINSITFLGSNYNVTGSSLMLSGGITCGQKTNANVFQILLTLTAPQTFQCTNGLASLSLGVISLGTNTLTMDGVGSNNVSSSIIGTGGVTKQGQGTLRYSAANSYTGQTWVRAGLLVLSAAPFSKTVVGPLVVGDASDSTLLADVVRVLSDDAIGHSSVVTVNSTGILDLEDVTVMQSLTLNGGAVTVGDNGVLEPDEVHATSVLVLKGLNFVELSATISGTGSMIPVNNNHYDFDVSEGSATPDLEVSVTLAVGGPSGTYSLFKSGNGMMSLSGTNDYRGATTVSNGVLRIDTVPSLSGTNFTAASGGTFQLNGLSITNPRCVLTLESRASEPGAFFASGGSNFWAGPVILAANGAIGVESNSVLNLSNVISGVGALTKEDPGLLLFTGSSSNSYGGATFIHEGTLECDKSIFGGSIPGDVFVGDGLGGTNAAVLFYSQAELNPLANVIVTNSGLYVLGGDTIGSLSGNGNVDIFPTGVLTVGGNNSSTTFAGTISDGGGLTKTGTGTFTLSGHNTYTGPTTVSAGTLVVNGSQASSTVTVRNAATLKGNGTVGNLNVATGGNVAPGTSPGRLTASNVVLSNDAVLHIELNGPTAGLDYDQLQVNGTLTITGSKLAPTLGFAPFEGESFTIAPNNGSDAVVGTFDSLANGAVTNVSGIPLRIVYNGLTGNDITLIVTNLPARPGAATLTTGNGDGRVDPNECDLLFLRVTNFNGIALTNVHGTLTSPTPGVLITQPFSAYPDLKTTGSAGTNLTAFQFFTTTNFLCGQSIEFWLTLTASNQTPFAVRYILQSGALSASVSFTNNTPVGIPPVGATASPLVVSNITGGLAKVTVSMSLTHQNLAELELLLIPPSGPAVVLTSGLPGTQLGTNCANGRVTFDDDAAQPIEAGSSPYVGTFRCDVPLSTLDGLSGSQVNGTWLLEIIDFVSNTSSGTLSCWSLTLTPAVCAAGGGPCAVCNGPFPDSITTNDLAMSVYLGSQGNPSVCGVAKACPGPVGFPTHYDAYTFTNAGGPACVIVTLDSPCTASSNALACAAYLNAFSPSNTCLNYLGDIGAFTNSPAAFAVSVPSNAVFVVVVDGAQADCPDYSLRVDGFDCPASVGIGRASNGRIRLNWPSYVSDFRLEWTTNLAVSNWTTATNIPAANGGDFVITNDIVAPATFYRLHKP